MSYINKYQETAISTSSMPDIYVDTNCLIDAGFTDFAGEYFPINCMIKVKCKDIDNSEFKKIHIYESFFNKENKSLSIDINTDLIIFNGDKLLYNSSLLNNKG